MSKWISLALLLIMPITAYADDDEQPPKLSHSIYVTHLGDRKMMVLDFDYKLKERLSLYIRSGGGFRRDLHGVTGGEIGIRFTW